MKLKFTKISKLPGGSIHEVWEIDMHGKPLALKILNPLILAKPEALNKILQGEEFAALCKAQGIPAVCALKLDGKIIHSIDNQVCLFYPWILGQQKYYPAFGVNEVKKIAAILAKMHQLRGAKRQDPKDGKRVFSHRDFDPKNVLWTGDEPHILDWEAADLIDPMEELVALAFEWSGFEQGKIDEMLFKTFFAAYQQAGGKIIQTNLQQGLQGFIRNYREWLEFNEQRLASHCSLDEKAVAAKEVIKTEKKLNFLNNNNALSLVI